MYEIKAPQSCTKSKQLTIFLAGSIEMGKAMNWQEEVVKALAGTEYVVLNPRRDSWDSSWSQQESNTVFREQVTWELDGIMDFSDLVFFYFDPNTQSPVTLLELGLVLGGGKSCIVCCPDGFFRKGNVDITCHRFGVQVLSTLQEGIDVLVKKSTEVTL